MAKSIVRVRADGPWSVEHPDSEHGRVILVPDKPWPADDPIVRAYPWAFDTDEVERATRAPGERRTTKRG